MPLIVLYLLKLSVSLAVMYLFYLLLLRRLTFYNHNRWYLVGYSLLCFFISLINISPMLDQSEIVQHSFVSYIPVMQNLNSVLETEKGFMEMIENWSIWNWLMATITAGTVLMLVRLVIQLFSFRKIIAKARLLSADDIKLYQVDENIIPFSFGNSIFINHRLHADEELKEIIRHEFVHVKQRHTVDIIWSEILVILNWYNPFAWLIRNAIRQNLEFIADHKVVQSGMDKTQYQYLLLKVIGNNHFSITNKFNFSSLKKRITMMNKIKTAKVHLLKFMFILPLLAVVLVSFRDEILPDDKPAAQYEGIGNSINDKYEAWWTKSLRLANRDTVPKPLEIKLIGLSEVKVEKPLEIQLTEVTIDTIPKALELKLLKQQDTLKALLLKLKDVEIDDNGNVKVEGKQVDKIIVDGKPVVKNNLQLRNSSEKQALYDGILKQVETYIEGVGNVNSGNQWNPQPTADEKDFLKRHPKIDKITWAYITSSTNNELIGKSGDAIMQLHFKNGSWDMYNISRKADVEKFKKNYGEAPPIAPPPPATKQPNVIGVSVENPVRKNVTLRGNVKALYDLNGINDPLFIVDGKKMTDFELKDLEPDTIESIDVLKDAKATQEYGSEARNGVIRIELKKAKEKAKN